MVVGGYSSYKPEIVDLSDPTKSCLLEEIRPVWAGTGGLLGTTPVICGGADGDSIASDDCLLYGTSQVIKMTSKRTFHSSIALNNSMLWVMGGKNEWHDGDFLDSTEFITKDGAVNGPKLPENYY